MTIVRTLLILIIVLTGNLSSSFFIFSISPGDIFLIIAFLLSVFYIPQRLRVTSTEILFLTFFCFVYIIPILINFYEINLYNNINWNINFILIRAWLAFKIFQNFNNRVTFVENYKSEFNSLILAGVLSGSIGVVRFLNLPYLTYIINHLWPIKGDQNLDILEWGRMETTVGGTNTGGVFFSILSVIILFKILTKNRRVYLNYFLLVFFVICTILTGSFTGVITFTISSIFLMLNLNPKPLKLFRFLLLGLTSTALFLNIPFVNEQLKGVIDKRYEENIVTMPEETYLPRSLHGRYYDWVGIAEVILSEKPFFGYGFILNNQTGANTTKFNPRYSLAENYYIQILVLSGLLGLIISIYFFYNIVLTVIKAKKYSYLDSIFVLSILLIYLFAQLTQITLQYSFLTFFFGILLANIHHLKISKCNTL